MNEIIIVRLSQFPWLFLKHKSVYICCILAEQPLLVLFQKNSPSKVRRSLAELMFGSFFKKNTNPKSVIVLFEETFTNSCRTFFFSRKEAKALVLLRRRVWATQPSAKPTQGVWGRAPSKTLR
jgi:hypothetical protein